MIHVDETRVKRLGKLVPSLLSWYQENARELPWREQADAFLVWITEIMLQQTRIEAVKPYYERFLNEFPDMEALAMASEERVLKLWEGLGYYSRARNLQKTARICMQNYGGELPDSEERLKKLPGIGNYTAGAVASISFGIPAPAVDGNVLRVFSRFFCEKRDKMNSHWRKEAEELIRRIIPRENPGAFNQGIMEIGETICLPKGAPLCGQCPLRDGCLAHGRGEEEKYPVKPQKRPRRVEEKTVFLLEYQGRIALRRRPSTGILAGMYEFPCLPGYWEEKEAIKQLQVTREATCVRKLPQAKHIFSHIEWEMQGWYISLEEEAQGDWIFVSPEDLREKYAIPTAYQTYTRCLFKKDGEDIN